HRGRGARRLPAALRREPRHHDRRRAAHGGDDRGGKDRPMDLKGRRVVLHDMSLRDGMHPKRHQISLEQMIRVSTALDAAGMPLIEVTHGDGLGGASLTYGFGKHTDEEYLRAVVPRMKRARVSALLLPGIGTIDDLRMAVDCGVGTIRVATHCT